ncbi:DUF4124 domain-containing protein [Ferrimonas sp. YFM]|uniref:DUF4124 domain-containing protein n=1 Tax=Ferrimonas sp. YFM TaxID=3028878 RepID=UPI0025726486|nr:DUF4124 domain-containing protein [Ferrimonas sp. YFM]BDY03043.1 hypothetical protein F0521_00840 [Ferrimonas sp. YFM]
MRTLLLLLLLCASAQAAIYRWVDDNGVAHYSDLPPHGQAQPVTITPGSQVSWRTLSPQRQAQPQAEAVVPGYSLAILSPQQDATVRSNEGKLTIRLATEPKPAPDHSLQLLIDGQAHQVTGSRLTLANLDRGSHQLQAIIVDQQGALLAQSPPVTVHLHRQSRLFGKPRHQQPPVQTPVP